MPFILAKYAEETIKVLYPIHYDRKISFQNEAKILKILNRKFQKDSQDFSVANGVVKLIDSCEARWKHEDDAIKIIDNCLATVHTYGKPLFPLLRRYIEINNRKMLFWCFSEMVNTKTNVFNVRVHF